MTSDSMISDDTKWLIFGMLVLFSLPICIMIFLFHVEVMPDIMKNGLSLAILDEMFYFAVASLVIGLSIEAFFIGIYELFN